MHLFIFSPFLLQFIPTYVEGRKGQELLESYENVSVDLEARQKLML